MDRSFPEHRWEGVTRVFLEKVVSDECMWWIGVSDQVEKVVV